MISRVCEEFGCLPSQALTEIENAPVGLIEDIMAMRALVATKYELDHAKSSADAPESPMVDLIFEFEAEHGK